MKACPWCRSFQEDKGSECLALVEWCLWVMQGNVFQTAHLGQSADHHNKLLQSHPGWNLRILLGLCVMAAHGCMARGMSMNGGENSLPLENKHITSERQQPLQTGGNASPTSISWLRLHFVLEGTYGLLSLIYFTQRSAGEKPQDSLSAEAVTP